MSAAAIASELLNVDRTYDRDYASDRTSRYGAYLRQRASWFTDDGEPIRPAAFATAAWQVATAPVMCPGFVRLGTSVWDVTCQRGDDPGLLLVVVEVRLPWPTGLRHAEVFSSWNSWATRRSWSDEPPRLVEPAEDRPAMLPSAQLRLPIRGADFPVPSAGAAPDLAAAIAAVDVICRRVNASAGPAVAHLIEHARARR